MTSHHLISTFLLLTCCGLWAAQTAESETSLKEKFREDFLIGAALNWRTFGNPDSLQAKVAAAQFNTITAENTLKWSALHPRPDEYRFDAADQFVEFGEKRGMALIGHTLIWHNQTPDWVFQDEEGNPVSREVLLERMRGHIHTVVGRYKGRIKGWDVVNEALANDGSLRDSPWRRIIGDDYILKAFEYAHEADPDAELYYNDYCIENRDKRAGAVKILKSLQAAGVPVAGVGIQEHVNLNWPSSALLHETIQAFADLKLKVMITELDVDVLPAKRNRQFVDAEITRKEKGDDALDPYRDELPEEAQQKLADRYSELFQVYLEHADVIERVTFWGVTDGDSWLNNFPVKGRTAHPLLFDRQGKAKMAFHAVIGIKTAQSSEENEPGKNR